LSARGLNFGTPQLLTSSEVELMETRLLVTQSLKSFVLLTSSEVELMETADFFTIVPPKYRLLTSSEVELMETFTKVTTEFIGTFDF